MSVIMVALVGICAIFACLDFWASVLRRKKLDSVVYGVFAALFLFAFWRLTSA